MHKSLLKLIKPVICVTLWLYFSLVVMILYVQDLNEDKMLYKNYFFTSELLEKYNKKMTLDSLINDSFLIHKAAYSKSLW